ncbi:molybdenum cofactor sulfurase 3 [Solenopsis invicta]|uniref:molybdenum cofactor sulfurase 3 n=1 Tax=Solenopsis invicta TaxID=13686 RepID=UPI00193E6C38|nr:molybdenum cofactor sulfurase 3 [Solenopsis invicta]XP_011156780.2 molybdenum cofactor sulfurase 3 [Solenopsis invicta]XP_025990992.2 molybdenum cofactor sulfurase 3 [Solenopsis invicta]XP_039314987.1 molybdenum cofactor sulfurase 3 [Solenopsis invicta]
MVETMMETTVEFTPVYDDATERFLASEFARLEGECYVDHAGATLYSDTQIRNVSADLHGSLYANPHSIGISSTQDIIERTRYRILSYFNTNPDEYSVIFTSGATASLKIIAEGFRFRTDGNDEKTIACPRSGSFVYMQDNHTSVLGMRDVVVARGAEVVCLGHDQAFQIFSQRSTSPDESNERQGDNSLFVYSAQCNFSGLKYPLKWISDTHAGALSVFSNRPLTRWYVLLDAASFVATNKLDLSIFKPDFVCLSFYKMFGYPTGIGALLVKNASSDILEKVYYGGGTVDVALSSERFNRKRQVLHQRFEDGTVPFLSIISLQYGFEILLKLTMDKISKHVFSLAKTLHHSLLMLHHCNGKPVVKLYSDSDYEDRGSQGGIVTFNLIRSNGEYVGYMEVVNMAALFKIHLRTGCFCNPGACQRHLSLSAKEILQNYEAGYTCGGAADLINGRPTGAVRVSFGYMSTIKDVRTVLLMINKCFVDEPCIRKFPQWWEDHRMGIRNNYTYRHFYNTNILDYSIPRVTNNKKNIINNNLRNDFHYKSEKSFDRIINPINSNKINKCTLQRLFIYPIKSCGAYEITDSWNLNSKGLEYDREWMIMTSSGTCLTQKHHTNLCLLKPVILKKQKIMKLTYPGMPTIEVPLDNVYEKSIKHPICQSRVCESRVQGIDYGSEVSEWLSLALGKPNVRLIRQSQKRQKKGLDKAELSFSSQAQYLAVNEASVSWLSDKVSDDLDFEKDTAVYRFRGNIIMKGCEAFDEMQWEHVRIGNNNFEVNGPCTRCQMICIDQITGKKTIEPLRTLAEEFHGKLKFGIYLTRLEKTQDTLKIGDCIYYS